MRFNFRLAALAATVAVASPAFAAPTVAKATAEARGLVLTPLSLTRVDDLDFGTILASAVAGSVTINADTGNRTVGGPVGAVTAIASNPGKRALFTGAGTAGEQVTLTLTPPAQSLLVSSTNPANTILVSSLVLDLNNSMTRTIGTGGTFDIGVGGTFDIAANQANGFYRADFEVTATYP